jgi:hypothetical protein
MKKTSKDKQTRILKRLFNGDSYDSAAKKEGVKSKTTVKDIFYEFIGRAEESSLENAAEEYEVSEEINLLRDLACESKRANVSVPDLLTSARLLALMKSLGLEPLQLKENLNMYKKHKEDFGDFVQAALRLSELEIETGKPYVQLIREYEKTKESVAEKREKIKELKKEKQTIDTDVKHLKKEITTRMQNLEDEISTKKREAENEIAAARKTFEDEINAERRELENDVETANKNFEILNQKSKDAQQVLDTSGRIRRDLAAYNLDFEDFETVRRFCKEIERLGRSPIKAVEILKKTVTLEAKVHEQENDFVYLKKTNEKLEEEKESLEGEIEKKKKALDHLRSVGNDTINKLEIEWTNGRKRNKALAQKYDDLLIKQAERLQVQPDIDMICEALPLSKKQLEELERKIKEDETTIAGATAISDLLSKKPSDRDAIITFLKMSKGEARYTPSDEMVRQSMVSIMAKEGFVPQQIIDIQKKDYDNKISKCNIQTQRWYDIAKRRLVYWTRSQNEWIKIHSEWEKKGDKQIAEKLAKLIVESGEAIAATKAEGDRLKAEENV